MHERFTADDAGLNELVAWLKPLAPIAMALPPVTAMARSAKSSSIRAARCSAA
jgi:hypothetical protein